MEEILTELPIKEILKAYGHHLHGYTQFLLLAQTEGYRYLIRGEEPILGAQRLPQ